MLQTCVQIATFFALLLTAYSVYLSRRQHVRQMNVETFRDYTSRFAAVVAQFPAEIWETRFDTDDAQHLDETGLRIAVWRYIALYSQEYYLWKQGYLEHTIWEMWSGEFIRTMNTPLFKAQWKKLRVQFENHDDFCQFVDESIV